MSENPNKIIYSMVRVAKTHKSTGKTVIRDISLTFTARRSVCLA